MMFSCNKSENNNVTPIDHWGDTTHSFSIVYNDGDPRVQFFESGDYSYRKNRIVLSEWSYKTGNIINQRLSYSSSDFNRFDTIFVDVTKLKFAGVNLVPDYSKVEIKLDGKVIASDIGSKSITLKVVLK